MRTNEFSERRSVVHVDWSAVSHLGGKAGHWLLLRRLFLSWCHECPHICFFPTGPLSLHESSFSCDQKSMWLNSVLELALKRIQAALGVLCHFAFWVTWSIQYHSFQFLRTKYGWMVSQRTSTSANTAHSPVRDSFLTSTTSFKQSSSHAQPVLIGNQSTYLAYQWTYSNYFHRCLDFIWARVCQAVSSCYNPFRMYEHTLTGTLWKQGISNCMWIPFRFRLTRSIITCQ